MSVALDIMSLIQTRRMSATSPRRGQLSGAIPIALRVRNFRRTATRMTVSIGVAVLVVMATVAPVSTASASSSDVPPPDKTALILGGSTVPTPDDYLVDAVKNHFIAPTHPGQDIEYVAVTTPEEAWPITGSSASSGSRSGPRALGAGWRRRGRTSRGGNSRGCSTSPSINQSRPGSPIWSRRWPSTATTIW